MSVFNPKTQRRETFDPVKHAGLFIVLWHSCTKYSRASAKVSQVIGPESTPNRATFDLIDEGRKLSARWDLSALPYIFTTIEECRAFAKPWR